MSKDHDENTTDSPSARLDRITSKAERRVAEYLVRAGPRAAALSAQEIGDATGTSDATVVRTAKTLGYANLRELRRALANDEEPDLSTRLHATISESPSAHDILVHAVDGQLDALNSLLRRVPAADFDRAANVLAGAAHIWWCGTGPSAHLASYAAFLCRRLGASSGALTHSGTDHADELLALRADHAIVVLAYGRVHPYVRVLLQRAAELRTSVVLITDTLGRSLTSSVEVQLTAGRGASRLFATHGPTIVLLEALVLTIAAADPDQSDTSLATLNDLRQSLAGRRLDVDPD
ncbi:MAG TPA: MurR/RpiR family transcriptional regulator [Acidimicrobiales bacterium]|jgi:DNA-binding MurR/RpiR family transcriptional regulator|nr:MurR/RpiR family transcriptional regulator [Acidimicrobiales bacterium]